MSLSVRFKSALTTHQAQESAGYAIALLTRF